jgi:hypothetical protein
MRTRPAEFPMNTIYTIEVVLEIRDGSGITTDALVERMGDAIWAHEDRGRLFAGRKMPDGQPWLLGTSVASTKIERKTDTREKPFDEEAFRTRVPFWDECLPDTMAASDIVEAIDNRVEELREIQAKLGDASQAMTSTTDRKVMLEARRKLRAMAARARAKLEQPIKITSTADEG